MIILELIGELLFLYLLYKFIFNFIIPVYQATVKVKKQFYDIQNKMHEHMNQQPPPPKSSSHSDVQEEYIDYEEIK
jgi:hypothetical protein